MLQTCVLPWSRLSVVLVGRGVEEDNGEHIQVPHAVGSCEKSTVHLQSVVSPVPVTFTNLKKNREI